ncbi:MAG TPA: tetratricopeptide repeat protein [Methylocella sp.]|nr:tetratricopeptide repeat protein [Methylocella sp.]
MDQRTRLELIKKLENLESALGDGAGGDLLLKAGLADLQVELGDNFRRGAEGTAGREAAQRKDQHAKRQAQKTLLPAKRGPCELEASEGNPSLVAEPSGTPASLAAKPAASEAPATTEGRVASEAGSRLSMIGPRRSFLERQGTREAEETDITASKRLLDALAQRIEESHERLAQRLDAGLTAAASELSALASHIAPIAERIQQIRNGQGKEGASIGELPSETPTAVEGGAAGVPPSLRQTVEKLVRGLDVLQEAAQQFGNGSTAFFEAHGAMAKVTADIAELRNSNVENWHSLHRALARALGLSEQAAKPVAGPPADGEVKRELSSKDPFVPILSLLVRERENGALSPRVLGRVAEGHQAGRIPQIQLNRDSQAPLQHLVGAELGENFLIEPGLGFSPRLARKAAGEQESSSESPKVGDGEGASRPDFISAARGAARRAQIEIQKSGDNATALPDKSLKYASGVQPVGEEPALPTPSLRRFRNFASWLRPLAFAAALLLAAAAGYALSKAYTAPRFRGVVAGFLKHLPHSLELSGGATEVFGTSKDRVADKPAETPTPPEHLPRQAGEENGAASSAGGEAAPTSRRTPPSDPAQAIPEGHATITGSFPTANPERGISSSSRAEGPQELSPHEPSSPGMIRQKSSAGGAERSASVVPNSFADLVEKAKSGDAQAELALGSYYAENSGDEKDYKLAAQWYEKAADQDVAVAEYRLATLFEKGLGVAQDLQKAKRLYQRAAEKGNTRAMHNLGVMAVEGGDGKPNYTSAALWFGKAAEFGVRDSQYNMAVLLARGLGVPKDLVKSYTWFSIVATSGDLDAAKKREEVAARLTSAELAAANAAAAAFHPQEADRPANEAEQALAGQLKAVQGRDLSTRPDDAQLNPYPAASK